MSANPEFEGVILAAGRGTRMQPFSERYPKPLLPILNRPLIGHQIEYLKSLGIRKVFIVIGHLGYEIALAMGRGAEYGVEIEYVEQRDSMGIAHALVQLERRLVKPFVLLLGDIYFEVDQAVNPIEIMLQSRASSVLAVMHEPNPKVIERNFAVHMDDAAVVSRVVEKPRFARSKWKGCGIYLFDSNFFDAVRRTPRSAARNEYELTDAIQTFIDDGAKVVAAPMMKCDINLTFPYDLLLANLRALHIIKQDNLIAADARIHPEAQLEGCIIGPRAEIALPISLRRTVILPDVNLRTKEWVDRAVVTPDRVVDCRYWIDDSLDPSNLESIHAIFT